MNGGVSWAQFDCDVDEHVHVFQGCTDVMHAARNTWHRVVDLSCFFRCSGCFVMRFRKQPPLIKKVQWSTFENRRGHDVMSTSFWFQRVPCVACFCCMPLASVTRKLLCFPLECQVVQHGCTLR